MNVEQLIEAIADGERIDWDEVLEAIPSENDHRSLIACLRIIATVSATHELPLGSQHLSRQELPFTSWGHLQMRSWLGRGAFGEVFLAWDDTLGQQVALKLFHRVEADGAKRWQVLQEIRNLARVRNSRVARILGADIHHGRLGFWMEYVDGTSLADQVAEQGPLREKQIIGIALDLCRGLQAVHEAGLFHGDVKPPNVVVDSRGRATLIDLGVGIAAQRHFKDGGPDRHGTRVCMAPELIASGERSEASDIFALGMTLFFAATGRYASERPEAQSDDSVRLRRAVSKDLLGLIERCLQPEPGRRFRDCDELATHVRRLSKRRAWRVIPAVSAGLLLAALVGQFVIRETFQELSSHPEPRGGEWSFLGMAAVVDRESFDGASDNPLRLSEISIWNPATDGVWRPRSMRGSLTLTTLQGDCRGPSASIQNLVVVPCGLDSFSATTKLEPWAPQDPGQQAGLFLLFDQDNYACLTVGVNTHVGGYVSPALQLLLEKQGLVIDSISTDLGSPRVVRPMAESRKETPLFGEVWLRFVKVGPRLVALWSEDGVEYHLLIERQFSFRPSHVGLAAFQAGGGHAQPIPARFDYVETRALCMVPPRGLVAWWTGDSTATDVIHGADGALMGGASYGQGLIAMAFSLDGIDDRIEIPADPGAVLDFGQYESFTYSAWIRTIGEWNAEIIEKQESPFDATRPFYQMSILADGTVSCGASAGGRIVQFGGNTPVNDGRYHHCACVRDIAEKALILYVDGREDARRLDSTTGTFANGVLVFGGARALNIRNFVGMIDEVQVYSRALSKQEIWDISRLGAFGFCRSDRIGGR